MATYNATNYEAMEGGRPTPVLQEVKRAVAYFTRNLDDGDIVRLFDLPTGAIPLAFMFGVDAGIAAASTAEIGIEGNTDLYVTQATMDTGSSSHVWPAEVNTPIAKGKNTILFEMEGADMTAAGDFVIACDYIMPYTQIG